MAWEPMNRREYLRNSAAGLLGAGLFPALSSVARAAAPAPKSVAGIITIYNPGSHADVILGKILEGWEHDRGPGPALTLKSLYVDQFPHDDLARDLAAKHGVTIYPTIAEALTCGTTQLAVDGVISIGEHGDYPWNDLGQHLYPRRRFFAEIAAVMERTGRSVPVFNDKHLGPAWDDAVWMYERAKALRMPFMAGSSLPLTFRQPDLTIPVGTDITAAVGVGYDALDIYGSHALECYQAVVERRRGGETGVRRVQALKGDRMWAAIDGGAIDRELFHAAFEAVPHRSLEELRRDPQAALFLFDYVDGFRGAMVMLGSSGQLTGLAVRIKGEAQPRATQFEERPVPRYPHFAYLLKGVERMIHTGRPTYPVERTLLTSGILDRALVSLSRDQTALETPELKIAYQPSSYPHAPRPNLLADPTQPWES